MKKILLITHSNSFGGAEKVLFWLAERLYENSCDVIVFNLNESNNGDDFQRPVTREIPVIASDNWGRGIFRHLNEIRSVIKTIQKNKPDLLISFTRLPNAIAGLSGRLTHTPVIISERSDPRVWYNSKLNTFLMKKAAELSNMCVFQTVAAQQHASMNWSGKSMVIPNPIFLPDNFALMLPKVRNKTVVSLGRLENFQKRYDILIEGFQIFHEKHPEYSLRIFGVGPDLNLIEDWVNQKGLVESVQFMGLSTNPFVDLRDDGIFALTSDFEGIPNSLLEAMALGLPVVSTDCEPGGARMLITDHQDGIIIPKNNPIFLAEAFCEYAESEQLANYCATNAKRVIERFNPTKVFQMWVDCIDQITGD